MKKTFRSLKAFNRWVKDTKVNLDSIQKIVVTLTEW